MDIGFYRIIRTSRISWLPLRHFKQSSGVLHFPRFCGKQKNNQQSESWLDGTIPSIEKNRQGHTPIRADSLHQARNYGFVVYLRVMNFDSFQILSY